MGERMKNVLKHAFDKHRGLAAGLMLVVAGGLSGGCANLQSTAQMLMSEGQPYTPGETALNKQIFGEAFQNREKARKYYFSNGCNGYPDSNAQYNSLTRNIAFCHSDVHEIDYSKAKDADRLGTYIHELTHDWQDQNYGVMLYWYFLVRTGESDYGLDKNSDFQDFGMEQQASIMGDYARRFLHIEQNRAYSYLIYLNTPETDALLQRIVENQFPGARGMRLAVEAQRAAAQQKMAGPVL